MENVDQKLQSILAHAIRERDPNLLRKLAELLEKRANHIDELDEILKAPPKHDKKQK